MTEVKKIRNNAGPQNWEGRKKQVFVIGGISCGKSSLLNRLFGLKEAVGVGETTTKRRVVWQNEEVDVCDTPGQNEDFTVEKPEVLYELLKAYRVFILYGSSLKSIGEMVQVVGAFLPDRTVLVRTKCDCF